jgi:hypothetical protein
VDAEETGPYATDDETEVDSVAKEEVSVLTVVVLDAVPVESAEEREAVFTARGGRGGVFAADLACFAAGATPRVVLVLTGTELIAAVGASGLGTELDMEARFSSRWERRWTKEGSLERVVESTSLRTAFTSVLPRPSNMSF